MTAEGWRDVVRWASRHEEGLSLLSQLLEEQDHAKAALRDMGFGCIGMPWPKVIEEIQRWREHYSNRT